MKKKHPLVERGLQKFKQSKHKDEIISFTGIPESDMLLNDLEHYPHAFVLACLMDKQIKAERAWTIPYNIMKIIGSFDINRLGQVSLDEYKSIFKTHKLHRFNDDLAEVFYLAVHRIIDVYDGNVSKIWQDCPSSAKVVYDFLQFKGAGVKISTMIANILSRDFKIPFSDYYSIDISPDVHIMRIMKRLGLVDKEADRDSVIYKARELYPEYPGIIDYSCWEIGRTWCHPIEPECQSCIIKECCKKII